MKCVCGNCARFLQHFLKIDNGNYVPAPTGCCKYYSGRKMTDESCLCFIKGEENALNYEQYGMFCSAVIDIFEKKLSGPAD